MKTLKTILVLLLISVGVYSQEVDSKAPDFTATDLNGDTINLFNLNKKVVVLDFWASWCVPCKKSMPHLIDLYDKNKDSSLIILGINVDEEKSKIKEFQKNIGVEINFPVIYDKDSKLPGLFMVEGMPTTVIISKEGIIKYKETGFSNNIKEKMDLTIKKLLEEN